MNTTVAKRIEFLNNFKAKRNDNTIVLFRDMDFYFMYNEDAENIGKMLGATGKIAHAEDFTFGAFASSKLDAYLTVIIRNGYRVAICDGEF
jgi:DNA mismatch repair ATPase MutS